MSNINVTPAFVLAGDATFTVSNGIEHFTYRAYRSEPNTQFPNPAWFISVLTGPDNTHDYTYLGKLNTTNRDTREPTILHTVKSKYGVDTKLWKVAQWALKAIWQQATYALPPGYSIKHVGRCGRCGRPLTVPASLDTGLGPECAEILGVEWMERVNTEWKKQRDLLVNHGTGALANG